MKQGLLLGLAVVALGAGIRLAGVADAVPAHVTGVGLSSLPLHVDVTLEVTVLSKRPASDGRPLLKVETEDGVQLLVYVSDDARAGVITEGGRYRMRATKAGNDFLTVVKPGSLRAAADVAAMVGVRADVRNGMAYLHEYSDAVVPAPDLPDGEYVGQLRSEGDSTRFVP